MAIRSKLEAGQTFRLSRSFLNPVCGEGDRTDWIRYYEIIPKGWFFSVHNVLAKHQRKALFFKVERFFDHHFACSEEDLRQYIDWMGFYEDAKPTVFVLPDEILAALEPSPPTTVREVFSTVNVDRRGQDVVLHRALETFFQKNFKLLSSLQEEYRAEAEAYHRMWDGTEEEQQEEMRKDQAVQKARQEFYIEEAKKLGIEEPYLEF